MGVGKSAVGRALARKLKMRFVDLDRFIEKGEGMKVREIFSRKGEAYFRQREKAALGDILAQEGQVIATGGGVIIDEENLRLLREKSLLVCLTAAPHVLLQRVGNNTRRPLLAGSNREERIKELLEQRENNYSKAHVRIETNHLNVQQVADKIIALLKKRQAAVRV